MRKLFALLLMLSALIVATAEHPVMAQSQLDKDAAFELASEFAQCAGLFDALSGLMKRAGKADAAKSLRETGNGAATASAMSGTLGTTPEKAWEMSNNMRDVFGSRWKAIVLNEGVSGEEVKQRMALCVELNPLQTQLIQDARKQAYGFRDRSEQ